ncbi:MAG: four helix bundle protein [Sphingobacteriaceae bacterium]|nr:four helix bundle protein [Sphingobacteriaceae bacterium]
MHNFKELRVWQKSIDLTVEVYTALSTFPDDEKFGLISQMKRASVSIPSNIAEGAGRNSNKEFKHFLSISLGSIFELETQLIISNRLGLVGDKSTQELNIKITDLQKMIFALEKTIS